jgi:RNA polymerase sporulation-specific sigma factor
VTADRLPSVMPDVELACRAADGCDRSFEELARRYRWLWTGVAVDKWFPGQAREDVHQEALIGLHEAAHGFNPGAGASFHTFARLVVGRRVIDRMVASLRGRHRMLSQAARFGHPMPVDGAEEDLPLDDVIATRIGGPEEIVEAREFLAPMRRMPMSGMERVVFYGRLVGLRYEEIADLVDGADQKSIDNALQRVKRKALAA